MPRRARMYIAGMPYHVVQRGNNREVCFLEPDNYQFYLELWQALSKRYGVAVHAYCLMTNHIHFLATPMDEMALSNAMKVVGSRYAQYVNKAYKRTGTMWEGRHRSSLVQSEKYLLTCSRYIELNPVRAGMVQRPEARKNPGQRGVFANISNNWSLTLVFRQSRNLPAGLELSSGNNN